MEELLGDTSAIQIFLMVLAGLLTAAVGVATKILKAWGDAQVAKIKNDDLRGRVQLAKDEIGDVVQMISQVMLPEIRAAAADGKITKDERTKLQSEALSQAHQRFGLEFWEKLMDELGVPRKNKEKWILDQVESSVFRMKEARGGRPGALVEPGAAPGVD